MAATKTLQKHKEELEAERGSLQATIAGLEAEHSEIGGGLPRLQAVAERSGAAADVKARDQAEAQIAGLELDIKRKRAALAAVTEDLEAVRQELAGQQRETWLQQIQKTRKEAGEVADRLDQDFMDADQWARLWDLYALFGTLRSQIGASGGFPPGADYGAKWRAPDAALEARLNAIREFEASVRKPGAHARGPQTMREALGL